MLLRCKYWSNAFVDDGLLPPPGTLLLTTGAPLIWADANVGAKPIRNADKMSNLRMATPIFGTTLSPVRRRNSSRRCQSMLFRLCDHLLELRLGHVEQQAVLVVT